MKKMGQIQAIAKTAKMTTTFKGYNHNEIISDGEMFNTMNLSDDLYPVLTVRKRRGVSNYDVSNTVVPLNGIHGRDQLVFIRGDEVWYNFIKVSGLTVSTASNMLPKKIVSMGAYVCIWPDKVYFNTIDLSDKGSMERKLTISGSNVSLSLCRLDGTNYDMTQITVSATAPAGPTNGQYWIDQSGDADVLRQYTTSTQEWTEVPTVYTKISGNGVGSGLKEYDAVDITGMEAQNSATQKVKDQVSELNGSHIVYQAGENYLVVVGLLSGTVSALKAQSVKINRTVPDLDFICESNNRLWGCKYGLENGKVVNEIRASKLGDFKNWSCFMGISTDSYTASIGTDGVWTGCVNQKGYPVFFKEQCIHKVTGGTPSAFQISTTKCRGVQRGSWRSVQIVNETVYYKSAGGVMSYDGNMPSEISTALGNVAYSDARAGAIGDKYYISMKDTSGAWRLFTYNTKSGNWYREDNTKALGFGAAGDELFLIDEINNTLLSVNGSVGTLEADPEWLAEFGITGVEYETNMYGKLSRNDQVGHEYLTRFDIRMYLEEGGKAELEIMYDSNGVWTKQGEIRGTRMRSFLLPVSARRCDHLRFRIKGRGEFRIYSIGRYLEVGADG